MYLAGRLAASRGCDEGQTEKMMLDFAVLYSLKSWRLPAA
jgi:hypothetical protein